MIGTLIAGALTGFIAGRYLEGKSFGPVGDVALGLLGALVAWFAVGLLGFGPTNLFGAIVTGFAGAILLRFGPNHNDKQEQTS
ncbi:GlsB/YeaQ/YmgE family stress response membrane protein [Kordiimonas lacus]|uniref:Uncharacterized membrane protein YeaQ/YmgE, transglycosylase-associated protein family n=1 Tax=Kordiimonas lacus TaxID=637679 RepID=A0A1G6Y6T1_9PROT|nr:GlsB/YeaQ/YmgE family stress response membrane protein [Kordiimonas lacus]SDD86129.1 Uncharacterized membrane protein YeaQ/YmgE, transglycosylase-associated protein family [Kordiimonas lacus]